MSTSMDGETFRNKVSSILISQPKPKSDKSPYYTLAQKYDIKVDFRPFIEVEGITSKEFRKHRISPLDYSAIIFTSRNAINHFFKLCEATRVKMPQETKYFCASEATALYLQKFILYRKRKVFYPKTGRQMALKDILKKHRSKEKFLLPCAENRKADLPNFLKDNSFNYSEVPIYRTVASDLSDLENIFYDMIVFFSPLGFKSLYENFPDFKQNKTRIAVFGPTTARVAAEDYSLRLDVKAPAPGITSMTMAIEKYLKEVGQTSK